MGSKTYGAAEVGRTHRDSSWTLCLGVRGASDLGRLLISATSLFRRTSQVSRARPSARAVFRDEKAGANGDAPSGIAGPIRALAVVTGSAIGSHRPKR
jgi:hypothetical protein